MYSKNAPRVYYTVYLRETEEVIAFGTARECAAMMGIKYCTFRSEASHAKSGRRQKYIFEKEPYEEE